MHLVVGLGNIGREYEKTRHNFGFLLLEQIIADYDFSLQSKNFKSEIYCGDISGKKIIAIKPQTLMNRSGIAVSQVASFYKIETKNIIVLHDDLDLELGRIKVKIGGGNGGHNGLKSIDEMVGKNYLRVRLGIGRPQNTEFATSDFVLGKFSLEEMQTVGKVNEKISDLADELLEGRLDGFMNKFYL